MIRYISNHLDLHNPDVWRVALFREVSCMNIGEEIEQPLNALLNSMQGCHRFKQKN